MQLLLHMVRIPYHPSSLMHCPGYKSGCETCVSSCSIQRKLFSWCSASNRPSWADLMFFWREWNWSWYHTSKPSGLYWTLNSHLKKHIKKVSNTIKFSILNFSQMRPFITTEAAKSYLHCMVLSHLESWSTVWSFTGSTVLQHLVQLYKNAIKVFEKKPQSYHHKIQEKYHFLSFDNFQTFKSTCLIYKCLLGLAPPPLE